MIGRLQGILITKEEGEVLLDVNGIGYEVELPASTLFELPEPGQPLLLHTHLVVREDAHHLFGFLELRERSLFRLLIKVNGIGPKLALGLLSSMDSRQLVRCITNNDVAALVKLPGIGRKTGERLVIELRDRLKDWELDAAPFVKAAPTTISGQSDALQEAEAALVALGYKPQEAARSVMQAAAMLDLAGNTPVTASVIRLALQNLGKGQN
jgi:holliday junction DNA helicase RuvA